MPPKPNRSPVLGYNHNLKYRGRIFHIQTEDSGPQNPRLFTHLYFGGTILASKKHEYDPAAAEDVVRALMQSQHKSILKELKAGKHDERVVRFFTARGETLDAAIVDTADPQVLDLDAAPEIQPGRANPAPTPGAVAFDLAGAPTFADTFEDEPTTPDQGGQAATARARPEAERPTPPPELPGGPSNVVPLPEAPGARRRPSRTPAMGAPVLIERAIGVGQQITAGARALFRGKRPGRSIPYVVKEGTHPLADEQPALTAPVPLTPPPTTAANAPLTSAAPNRYPAPPPAPAEKTLDEVILAYLSQGTEER